MPRNRTYHVSGIAQITVTARTAAEAVAKAMDIAERRNTRALFIELDNISTDSHASVSLDDAAQLDPRDITSEG
jgi:hypothetical protein